MSASHASLETADPALRSAIARVRATGEPLVFEEAGEEVAAVVSARDLQYLRWIREGRSEWIRRAAAAAERHPELASLTDDEIVARAKVTRRELSREKHGGR